MEAQQEWKWLSKRRPEAGLDCLYNEGISLSSGEGFVPGFLRPLENYYEYAVVPRL